MSEAPVKKVPNNAMQAVINELEKREGEPVLVYNGARSHSGFIGKVFKGRYVSHLEVIEDGVTKLCPINYSTIQLKGGKRPC